MKELNYDDDHKPDERIIIGIDNANRSQGSMSQSYVFLSM